MLGSALGIAVGEAEGTALGLSVGTLVGYLVGECVGTLVGLVDGIWLGLSEISGTVLRSSSASPEFGLFSCRCSLRLALLIWRSIPSALSSAPSIEPHVSSPTSFLVSLKFLEKFSSILM